MNNITTASRPPLLDHRPPLSPMSVAGSDWSGISTYKSPTDSGSTMSRTASSSGPSMGRSSNTSPPSSVARSSDGMRMYEDSPNMRPRMRMPPRRDQKLDDEQQVARQHAALKALLEPYLKAEKNDSKANKARDKLLRLTGIQFQELSTDVYDELQRRQGAGDRLSTASGVSKTGPTELPEGATPYLMPRPEFHPKRNQARQKLSTLPPPRFRDLATDVFYELERRYPYVTGSGIDRSASPASSLRDNSPNNQQDRRPKPAPLNPNPQNGAQRPGPGGFGPQPRTPTGLGPGAGPGGPGGPGGPNGFGPPNGMGGPPNGMGGPPNGMGGPPNGPGAGPNSFGRPLPKNLPPQNRPDKPVSDEDYDEMPNDEDEDALREEQYRQSGNANKRAVNGRESSASNTSSSREPLSNQADKKLIADYQVQVSTLQKKLDEIEFQTREKDREISRLKDAEQLWKDDEEELRSVQSQLKVLQGHNEHVCPDKLQ
ncbi:component of the polarisome [Orbilia javanica]|uniref:Component of the polarisome n=1 Tax=Orbilia javanica TaxID=47235 RepID=A0AAN8RDB8_9PEZI